MGENRRTLILADVGVHTTMDTIARLRATAEDQGLVKVGWFRPTQVADDDRAVSR